MEVFALNMLSLKCLYDSAAEGMGQARESWEPLTCEIRGDGLGGKVGRGGVWDWQGVQMRKRRT